MGRDERVARQPHGAKGAKYFFVAFVPLPFVRLRTQKSVRLPPGASLNAQGVPIMRASTLIALNAKEEDAKPKKDGTIPDSEFVSAARKPSVRQPRREAHYLP